MDFLSTSFQRAGSIPTAVLFYFGISCLFFAFMLAYMLMARFFRIIDDPNERSSHKHPTISGAGILFPAAALLWYFLSGMQHSLILFATLLLGAISFMDDLKHVNAKVRVFFHFVAAGLLLIDTGFIYQQWYALFLAYLLVVGYVNAGNFMDGINGMTAFFHIITFGSFILMENVRFFNPAAITLESSALTLSLFPPGFVIILFLSVLVFTFFNARTQAVVFAGDAGSISLSFLVAWLIVGLMLATGNYFWILFIATYGIDTSYTMIVRLRKRQKPLEAHRTHLHHLLVDVKGYPHLIISGAYAITQLIINVFTIRMIESGKMNIFMFFITLLILVGAYAFFRNKILRSQGVVHANTG